MNATEKRRTQRFPVESGQPHGKVKSAVPVTVIDVSCSGMQLELAAALRPGSVYDVSAQLDTITLTAQVRITRCRAGGFVSDGKGGRLLLYRAGAQFVDLPTSQAAQLAAWMEGRVAADPRPKGELLEPAG